MNLITGRAGAAHITPRQDAMWHQGLTETESCIFDAYENFAAEIITNNEIRIRSGVGMLQGRFFCIEPNTYDTADIANGTQGEYRKDLIVARITVDATTNTQSATITVIQGTPAAENPVAPEAVTGDLDAGDLIADYPLVEVLLNGINIESITPVFDTGWLFNAEGRQKLNFIGINPITSTDDDTPANWAALGTGHAYFNAMRLNNQPTRFGFVENIVSGELVFQTFYSMNGSSPVWHRSGNANGWYSASTGWVKSLDETNGLSTELLWENASPTSAFAAQAVSLELSEDSKIIIEFNSDISSEVKDIQSIIDLAVVGKGGVAIRIGGVQDNYLGHIHFRYYQVTSNSIIFNDSYYQPWAGTTAALNNNFDIPYRVYRIKGGL